MSDINQDQIDTPDDLVSPTPMVELVVEASPMAIIPNATSIPTVITAVPEQVVAVQSVTPAIEASQPEVVTEAVAVASDEPVVATAHTENVVDVEEEPEFNFPPPEAINNATQEKNVYATVKTWDDGAITITLPPDTAARTRNYIEQQPNADLGSFPESADWFQNVELGLQHGSMHDGLLPAAKRKDANWRQFLTHGVKKLDIAIPKIGDDGPMLTGQRGILRVKALINTGSLMSIPLWHTGMHVTLRAPKETELLDMWQRIADEKIRLGRSTHGLVFANHTVFMAEALVSLAFECFYECSVKDITSGAQLRSLIKTPDLNILAWGLACVVWPSGFQYSRSLLDEKGQRTQTIQDKLNVGSLCWIDENSLDEWQRAHMANRSTGSMTRETVKMYQDHFTRGKAKTVELTDKIHITLRVPTLEQFLNSGQQWVNETVAMVSASFTDETDINQRNKLILERGKATSLRQYVHWIESFEFPGIGKRMIDETTIAELCSELSSDDDIRDKYYKVMLEFINDSMIAIIATPLADAKEKDQTLPKFPWLLPLDPIAMFFTLLYQKVAQIQMRP